MPYWIKFQLKVAWKTEMCNFLRQGSVVTGRCYLVCERVAEQTKKKKGVKINFVKHVRKCSSLLLSIIMIMCGCKVLMFRYTVLISKRMIRRIWSELVENESPLNRSNTCFQVIYFSSYYHNVLLPNNLQHS